MRLAQRGVGAQEHDFFAERLGHAELEDLARRAGGVRAIFAFSSPSFRKLGRSPESLSDQRLLDMILEEPRLLRRPLLLTDDGRVLVGGKAVSAV